MPTAITSVRKKIPNICVPIKWHLGYSRRWEIMNSDYIVMAFSVIQSKNKL